MHTQHESLEGDLYVQDSEQSHTPQQLRRNFIHGLHCSGGGIGLLPLRLHGAGLRALGHKASEAIHEVVMPFEELRNAGADILDGDSRYPLTKGVRKDISMVGPEWATCHTQQRWATKKIEARGTHCFNLYSFITFKKSP